MKDIIRWPRPSSPPVIRLEDRYALEYGMPSTHAMVGVAIPFGLLLASLYRYNLILWLSLAIAVTWTASICISRLYLGKRMARRAEWGNSEPLPSSFPERNMKQVRKRSGIATHPDCIPSCVASGGAERNCPMQSELPYPTYFWRRSTGRYEQKENLPFFHTQILYIYYTYIRGGHH